LTLNVFDQRKIKCPVIVDLKSNEVRSGSTPVLPTRSRAGLLPGVKQTEPGESGPLAVDLPQSGV
jgi:hypothetical protein